MAPRAVKVSQYAEDTRRIEDAVKKLRLYNCPNIHQYATDNALPYKRLLRAYKGLPNRSTRPPTNRKLSMEQDLALCRFLDAIDAIGFGIHHGLIEQQANANALLDESYLGTQEDAPTIGKHWARRWLLFHPEYRRVKAKPTELAGKFAQQPDGVRAWYQKLREVADAKGILPEDMWNMDECGCCARKTSTFILSRAAR